MPRLRRKYIVAAAVGNLSYNDSSNPQFSLPPRHRNAVRNMTMNPLSPARQITVLGVAAGRCY